MKNSSINNSIKYFALSTALIGITAFNTTGVYAEDTPAPTGTPAPAASTQAPAPTPQPVGEQFVNGHWMYFRADGTFATGLTDLGYKKVLYGDDGQMLFGFQNYGGKTYYFKPGNGTQQFGEQYIDGHWYHFDDTTGEMSVGLTNIGYKEVLYAGNGQMLFGLQNVNGKVYYFKPGSGAHIQLYGEHFIDGHWYHFNEQTGEMSVGITDLGYKKVLYGDNGQMLFGLQNYGGKTYYFKPGNGTQQFGEQYIDGHWYHFNEQTGEMSVGITDLGYKKVLYGDNGQMLFGIQNYGDKTYYFKPGNGAQQFGEQFVDGHWYYFEPGTGAMARGLTNLGYKTVYYDQNGQMLYGVQSLQLNNDTQPYLYFFDRGNGSLGTSGWIEDRHTHDRYYADGNNHLLTGENTIGDRIYYFDGQGINRTGLNRDNNSFYTSDGQKITDLRGEKYLDGHWYYFDPSTGAMATGITNLGYKTVYYDSNGRMQFGEQRINGNWYYFNPHTGAMATGITNIGYKTVYYDANGRMQFGEQRINGNWYYFNPGNGAMATGLTNIGYKTVYYDNNGVMAFHDFDLNGVHYSVNPSTGEAKVAVYKHGTVPYMKQNDPRWANRIYGGRTMASTACGVTTIAMNLTAWTGYTILPPTVADYLHAVGEYNVRSAGTTGYSRIAAGNHWGLKVDKITSLEQMKTALAQGKTISEMSGAGSFSNGSHGVTIFGNNNGYATAFDPYNSRNNGSYSIDYLWNARSKDPADYDAGAVIFAYYR